MLLVEIIFEIFWDWECQLDSLQKVPNQQTDFHQLQAFFTWFYLVKLDYLLKVEPKTE